MQLTDNTIFVAGGTSGIGRGLAEAFHKLGNKVIIGGRRKALLDEVTRAKPGMRAVELDIADPASIERAAAALIAAYPTLNVLIDNAGPDEHKLVNDFNALIAASDPRGGVNRQGLFRRSASPVTMSS